MFALLLAVLLLCYGSTLRALVLDWWTDPDYSFGLMTPLAIAYLIYGRRRRLRQLALVPRPVAGYAVVAISQLVFLAGYAAAEFFLQRTSIVLLLAGVVLCLAGSNWLKQMVLPLALLELSIPLPTVLMQSISMPLQLVASWSAEMLLRLMGFSVFRSGNVLQLPRQLLNVGQACSGLRSLSSMVALALLLLAFSRLKVAAQAIFVASAVVVAIVANAIRVAGTGVLSQYAGAAAIYGLWHTLEGWLVFVMAFLMLSAEHWYLQRLWCADPSEARV